MFRVSTALLVRGLFCGTASCADHRLGGSKALISIVPSAINLGVFEVRGQIGGITRKDLEKLVEGIYRTSAGGSDVNAGNIRI